MHHNTRVHGAVVVPNLDCMCVSFGTIENENLPSENHLCSVVFFQAILPVVFMII